MIYERGIIKALILLVVALSVLFLLSGFAANTAAPIIKPDTSASGGKSQDYPGPYSNDYESGTNSLIDFLGDGDYGSGSGRTENTDIDSKNKSPYAGTVSLGMGSASWAIQPYEEYVTIENSGAPVNITGWKLQNGKGTRPIQYSQNSYIYPNPEYALIGQGTEFLEPKGKYSIGPIILAKGDTAIVTTSGPFTYFPVPISASFRENMCLGYLSNYPFFPSVERRCPYAADDRDISAVTDECYDYIRSLGRCEDPEKTNEDGLEEQTTFCRAFIRARLNYPSCVSLNRYSPEFASKRWRVFLGRSHELWASGRELITLYDATGLIVDQISY